MNALVAIVALVAACFAGLVMFELRPAVEPLDQGPAAASAPQAGSRETPAAVQAAVPAATAAANRETLLGRPLFSQTRRPPNVTSPAAAAAAAEPLPRMTGILIDGPNRRAIFAAPQGGKATILVEGGHLGAFTVQSIEPRQVTVVGPDGKRTLRTAFDPTLPAPSPLPTAGFVPPQFPGIQMPGGRVPGSPIPSSGVPSSPYSSQPSTPGLDAGNGFPPGAAR